MWRNVTFLVSAFLVLTIAADLFGFYSSSLRNLLPIGINIGTLKDAALGIAFIYFAVIRPIIKIIQEYKDGWLFMESVVKHFISLSFLSFTLVFCVAPSGKMALVCFLGFTLCCLLYLIAILSFLEHKDHVDRVNEYLDCLRDPHKKYVGDPYPRQKTKPKDRDQRWTFEKQKS